MTAAAVPQPPAVKSRKPTCAVPYPFILLEGEEKSGKTWTAIKLSASPRIGRHFMLDLGEASGDEYGAIPGADFELLEHDGSWAQIMTRVNEAFAYAQWAAANAQPPTVLHIDTMSDEWEGLKDWASELARQRLRSRGKKVDPLAEVQVSNDLWNLASGRHRKLMLRLLTFPGIVIATARGALVTEVKDGKPVEGSKIWRVEGQKNLAFDASVWVRMFRDSRPQIIGARSVHAGVKPGDDKPRIIPGDHENLLDWLIFDELKVDPRTSHVRDLHFTRGGDLTDEERLDLARPEQDQRPSSQNRTERPRQQQRGPSRNDVPQQRQAEQKAPAGPTKEQLATRACSVARQLASVDTLDGLTDLWRQHAQDTDLVVQDITDCFTDDELTVIKAKEGERYKLGRWAHLAKAYLEKYGEPVEFAAKQLAAAEKDLAAHSQGAAQ